VATVAITELKAKLARYLRMAQRGVEVQVLDRGVPIARLVAMPDAGDSESAALDRLVSAGLVRRGNGGVRALLERRLRVSADLQGALSEDREDRV
jgi:prevent-host-death family protein